MIKKILIVLSILGLVGCKTDLTQLNDNGYINLYNGQDLNDWNIMCRDFNKELAEKVFTSGENGVMHVFKDFEDEFGFKENRNETHCMFFSNKEYSRYSFKFEYKWGAKRFNNFDTYQYDAGMYYHVFDAKVWPQGLEYQVRYNHLEDLNHTGDIWNSGAQFDWYAQEGESSTKELSYLSPQEGGVAQKYRGGEHRASKKTVYNGLNGRWNKCEVIVMGNKYAVHILNDKVVNVLRNLSHSKGVIGLQAETAEIFYRNIEVKEFNSDIPIEKVLEKYK
ncbi:DUF1080 domain-containing protein [Croceitalea marina]|uniref:DUF1080 domain-containing protein n=1 Tax=Croceitalea marina TaxID=1775166 RepID=A0ABW5MWD8_9FLAO